MSERCEPPLELRGKDGWHWVDSTRWVQPDILRWRLNSDNQEYEWLLSSGAFVSSESETANAWRYLAPVTPSATVAALVEALEWMITNDDTNEGDTPMPELGGQTWDEFNAYWIEGLNRARAALALYREAGR